MRLKFVQFDRPILLPNGDSKDHINLAPRPGIHPARLDNFVAELVREDRFVQITVASGAKQGLSRFVPIHSVRAFDEADVLTERPKAGPGRGHREAKA